MLFSLFLTFLWKFTHVTKKVMSLLHLFRSFSNRKVRGPLNFDDVDAGLVSDSMVANSLYLQNGSCASSSGAPVKTEQPDSWKLNVVYILVVSFLIHLKVHTILSLVFMRWGALYERWDCRMPPLPLPSLVLLCMFRYLVQNVGWSLI